AARPRRPRAAGIGRGLAHGQPAPRDLPGQAEIVQPFGAVGLDALREQPLPISGGPLEALELLDDLGETCPSMQARSRRGMPPVLQELPPALLAHRVHLRPPAVARVAVDARQQPPRAPLLAAFGLEAPADREPPSAQ